MNTSPPTPRAQPLPPPAMGSARPADANRISLADLLDMVVEQRWVIGLITALVMGLGGTYAYMATPVFEASTLIQIEESKGNLLGGVIGEAGNSTRSSTAAEIEILRSRLVAGQVVENLGLDLIVRPRHIPVVGRWMARRASEPSEPGLFGMPGYVSGNEALRVTHLKVPLALRGQGYIVTLSGAGYVISKADGSALGQGSFGKPLVFKDGTHSGEILVQSAIGKPGAEFTVAAASLQAVTQALQGAIKISEQGRGSGVIRVGVENADPVLAARIVNEIGALYVRQNTERKVVEAEKSLSFLNSQLPQLRAQVEDAENKFNRYRIEKGVFDLSAEAKEVLDQTIELRAKLLDLNQKRRELDARFTAEHPSMQAMEEQIKEVNTRLATLDARLKTLPGTEQDLLRLTREVKVSTDLYTSLLNSFQQMRLAKEGKVGNVRVVDVAIVPESPIKPQRSQIVLLAALAGLLAGVAVAFMRHLLRPGIRDAAEIEAQLGLPVYATVPRSPAQAALAVDIAARKPGVHLLAETHPEDPSIESLRSLRTALQFAVLDASNKIVLITGPTPVIGKSFITANFAAVLATSGKRVLLIDADLRKGHIHQYFSLPRANGLSELIVGTQPLSQVLHRNVQPKLDLITTGVLPPNPAELLMSAAASSLLQGLSTAYDIVLIDTPPVLAVSDTSTLAQQAGTVFMVVRAEVTSLGELQEAIKRIGHSGGNVRGVVFNDLPLNKRRYGYGTKYNRYRYKQVEYK